MLFSWLFVILFVTTDVNSLLCWQTASVYPYLTDGAKQVECTTGDYCEINYTYNPWADAIYYEWGCGGTLCPSISEHRDDYRCCRGDLCNSGNWTQRQICPSGYLHQPDEDICFLWLKEIKDSMPSSRSVCQEQGGDLPSIHNAFQNQMTVRMQEGRSWLGASKDEISGEWSWVDGTPFDYQRFQSQNVSGSCAYLDPSGDSSWRIADCETPMATLCVVPPCRTENCPFPTNEATKFER